MKGNTKQRYKHLKVNEVPVVSPDDRIADVKELLLKKIKGFESIDYIYLVNAKNKLVGVISVKEVFRSPGRALVKSLSKKQLAVAHRYSSPEHVAYLALRHNIKAVPLVDKTGAFIGVVSSDEIFQIIDSEAVENLLRFGGIFKPRFHDDVIHTSLFKSLKHRLPWLVVGLVGGIFASGIVNSFEATLEKNLMLAAFIPLIVYMSDAVGTQMEAFIIRDIALDDKFVFWRYFFRQAAIVLVIACILSTSLCIGGALLYHDYQIALVISLALFFAIISSLITGLVVPYLFNRFKFDPANASGPIATIIQDLTSVFIYFSIAALLL